MSPRTPTAKANTCRVCPSPVFAKGLCSRCYQRERKGLPATAEAERQSTEGGCEVCGDPVLAKGLCGRCYRRREKGLPDEPRKRVRWGLATQLSVGVTEEVAELVRQRAAATDEGSINQWLRGAIEEQVARQLEAPPPVTKRKRQQERGEPKRHQLNVGVEEGIAQVIRELASRSGESLNEWLRQAIAARLALRR